MIKGDGGSLGTDKGKAGGMGQPQDNKFKLAEASGAKG